MLVKAEWFRTHKESERPATFEMVFQSWDTANKPTELSDYSVCTTWGTKDKHLYLLHVMRKRVGYPELKRAVREQAEAFGPKTILIEDKASGTQLIQDLVNEGIYAVKKYEPTMDKVMRMHSVTGTIENGFVHLPDQAAWLDGYIHELTTFPYGRHDDQVDSTSQALDWIKNRSSELGDIPWLRFLARRNMIEEGWFREVAETDAKYGAPPGEPAPRPSSDLEVISDESDATRKTMIDEGRLDGARDIDAKCGAPPEESNPAPPSGLAVHTPTDEPQSPAPSGPAVCQGSVSTPAVYRKR